MLSCTLRLKILEIKLFQIEMNSLLILSISHHGESGGKFCEARGFHCAGLFFSSQNYEMKRTFIADSIETGRVCNEEEDLSFQRSTNTYVGSFVMVADLNSKYVR